MDALTSLTGRLHASQAGAPHSRGGSPVVGDRPTSNAQSADEKSKSDPRSVTEIVGHRVAQGVGDAETVTKTQLLEEQKQVRKLSERDREVRAHEQAHASTGGQYTGSPNFQYQRGPNGVNYAVGGHVSIDASAVEGNPRATLQKAQVIRRAALAPAEPSAQDRSVAARASQMALKAQAELAQLVQEGRLSNNAEDESSSRVSEGSKGAFVDISV